MVLRQDSTAYKFESRERSTADRVFGIGKGPEKDPDHDCEDAIVRRPDQGLGAVLDGLSTGGGGGMASLEAAKVINENLAEKLSNRMAEMRRQDYDDNEIAEFVRRQFQRSAQEANELINEKQVTENYLDAKTTFSVAKIENTPDQRRVLYTGHLGDSRIMVFDTQTKKLKRITTDDNMLNASAADWRRYRRENSALRNLPAEPPTDDIRKQIDQYTSMDSLYEKGISGYLRSSDVVTKTIGNQPEAPEIQFGAYLLSANEVVVVCSDGISDNLLDSEIEEILSGLKDDRGYEAALQQIANRVSESGFGRAKPDDKAVVVLGAESKIKMKTSANEFQPVEYGLDDIKNWQTRISRIDQDIEKANSVAKNLQMVDFNISEIERLTNQAELIKKEFEINQLSQEQAKLIWWVAKISAEQEKGEQVSNIEYAQTQRAQETRVIGLKADASLIEQRQQAADLALIKAKTME